MFKSAFSKTALLVAGVMMAGAVSAKEMKIGFVDVREVFSQLPQAAKLQETMKAEFGGKIAEIQKLEKDIAFNVEKFKRDGSTMNEDQKKKLQEEIGKQQQQYEQLARPLSEQIRQRPPQINHRPRFFSANVRVKSSDNWLFFALNQHKQHYVLPTLEPLSLF